MQLSFYQSIKPIIEEVLGLSRDAIHIHIGFMCFFIAALVMRKKLTPQLLIPGLVVSVAMEVMDVYDSMKFGKIYVAASVHDLVNTNLIPVMIYVLLALRAREKVSEQSDG